MHAIEVRELRKVYGGVAVVDGVSFDIEAGEVFALLGPNGAGKTTTVEILEGHREADGGTATVLGHDPRRRERAYRERIGIVLQEAGFEEDFTVVELLRLQRAMYSRRLDADALVDLVGLGEKRKARVSTLSGGQRRRLDLALGLVGDPELVFLDEPTVGFDPEARRRAWAVVEELRQLGKTVLLTTHYLDEAQQLADRVAVMVSGRLAALGTPTELAAAERATVVTFRLGDGLAASAAPDVGAPLVEEGAGWRLATEHPSAALRALTDWAVRNGGELEALEVRRPTLEDAYLALVGTAAAHSAEAAEVAP
jgi:ABC-2 type transport system ATP-binding protein